VEGCRHFGGFKPVNLPLKYGPASVIHAGAVLEKNIWEYCPPPPKWRLSGGVALWHNVHGDRMKEPLMTFIWHHHNCPIETTHSQSWHNLRWTSPFSDQISSLSKSCYSHIHALRCIRLYLDFRTVSIIATSIVHSKLDYCNSLYFNLPNSQINRLQQIQNSRSHCCQISQVLIHHSCNQVSALVKGQGTYWVQASLSQVLTTSQPTYLSKLVAVQSSHSIRF